MRACWLKWVGRDWSISADYIWLNYSDANIACAHNATAAQLFGESTGRAASGNEVLDPSVVLVSLERYPLSGAFDRHLCSWLSGRVDISWY